MREITEKLKVNQIKEMITIYQGTDLSVMENENLKLMKLDLNDKKNQLENVKKLFEVQLSELFNNGANQIDMEVQALQNDISDIADSIDNIEDLIITLDVKLQNNSSSKVDKIENFVIKNEKIEENVDDDYTYYEDENQEESLFENTGDDQSEYRINDFSDEEYEYVDIDEYDEDDQDEDEEENEKEATEGYIVQDNDESVDTQDNFESNTNDFYDENDNNDYEQNEYDKESEIENNDYEENESTTNDYQEIEEISYSDEESNENELNLTIDDLENAKDIILNRIDLFKDPEDALNKGERVAQNLMKNLENVLLNK